MSTMRSQAGATKAQFTVGGRSVKSVVVAIILAYASLRGVSACDESDEQPTPLSSAYLLAPSPDASPDGATDGASTGDGTTVTDAGVDGSDAALVDGPSSAQEAAADDGDEAGGDADAGDF